MKKKDGFRYQKLITLSPESMEACRVDAAIRHLYVTDIGFFPNAVDHFRERSGDCEEYILLYNIEGEGNVSIAGTQPVILKKNEVLIIPRRTPHAYWASAANPWSIYFFHMRGELADSYFNRIALKCALPLNDEQNSRFIELFEECYACVKCEGNGTLLVYASKIAEYLLWYLIASCSPDIVAAMKKASKENKTVEAAIHYMKENIYNQLSLEDICKEIGFSPSYFTKLFKKATGYPPIEYYLRQKIQAACRLLTSTELRVNEIGYCLQFRDPFYFSRLFKRFTGLSPKAYRAFSTEI